MKRILRHASSPILANLWQYGVHSEKIRLQLENEQSGYCAYTEVKLDPTYARDIEHFNPTLKNKPTDSYYNWYAVGHKWNNKKRSKWANFQPVLSPDDPNIEIVFTYNNGRYDYDPLNVEAGNLDKLIDINSYNLVKMRSNYIKGLQELVSYGIDIKEYLRNNPDFIKFRRAIESVFGFCP